MMKSFLSRTRAFTTVVLLGAMPLAGCVGTSSAGMQSSQDGRFTVHDIRLQKGGLVHWAVLGVDNATGQVIVNFGGETLTLGRQLVENLLSEGVLASVISGAAGIRIAENGSCGGKGCSGNIFYVQAVSGSVAGAEAEAGANASSGGGQYHKSSKGMGGENLVIGLTEEQLVVYNTTKKMLEQALQTAY